MADTPPPPPPPDSDFGMNNGNGDSYTDIGNGDDGAGLGQATPNVAAKPGRVLVVLAIVGMVVGLLLYLIFSSGNKDSSNKDPKEIAVPANPVIPPPVPPNNPIPELPLPTAPVIPPPTQTPTIIEPKDDSAQKQQALARMRSTMLVASGSGGGGGSIFSGDSKPANNDANSQFAAATIKATTEAERVEATRIGDLRRTIAQGRLIQATMESALNTDLPAPIRAIVSRDTYGEAGTTPLIPKGSRLIGSYNTDLSGGQVRVFVIWTRVIRPDGVDVALGSPLVDQIGQAGISGMVDTKFQQIFSRAVMASLVTISFASAQDKLFGGQTSTSTNSAGGSTTTGDTASTATVNALNRLGSVTDGFIQKYIDVRATILVDQGTKVNVFVNRDLVFPASVTGSPIVN